MNDLKTILNEIETIAREWRDFSREVNGWTTIEYGDNLVRCYFADESDHTAVTIGNFPNEIQTSFFSPPRINGFSSIGCDIIPSIIESARKLLDLEKQKFAKRSADEVKAAKDARLQRLKEELQQLQGDLVA